MGAEIILMWILTMILLVVAHTIETEQWGTLIGLGCVFIIPILFYYLLALGDWIISAIRRKDK
jgi:hypothetical protein